VRVLVGGKVLVGVSVTVGVFVTVGVDVGVGEASEKLHEVSRTNAASMNKVKMRIDFIFPPRQDKCDRVLRRV
jgi:hypothetical protein